jgi:hypothetical protein
MKYTKYLRQPPRWQSHPEKPVQDVRLGLIKAAIWENAVGDIVLQRHFLPNL